MSTAPKSNRTTLEPYSPLPWRVDSNPEEEYPFIDSREGRVATVHGGAVRVSEMGRLPSSRRKNAEFIVRACNAHDDLVEVVRELVTAFNGGEIEAADWPLMNKAVSALAKAEGK